MKKVTHKNLMIWLPSQSFVGSSSILRRRSQQRHQSFPKFTFISMEAVLGDVTAALCHNLLKLVEVGENLKSFFSDGHKTFLHALGICL